MMVTHGKLIAIEGIDGSGKRTQLDLLASALNARGVDTFRMSCPRYETFYGKLVGRYLNGDFGALDAVDPHLSALLYAGDRLEAKPEMDAALSAGKIGLADRYIGSNMAHQSARIPPRPVLRSLLRPLIWLSSTTRMMDPNPAAGGLP